MEPSYREIGTDEMMPALEPETALAPQEPPQVLPQVPITHAYNPECLCPFCVTHRLTVLEQARKQMEMAATQYQKALQGVFEAQEAVKQTLRDL